MSQGLDPEDLELDRLWKERFGEPLPMRGCGDAAWELLKAAGPPPETRTFSEPA